MYQILSSCSCTLSQGCPKCTFDLKCRDPNMELNKDNNINPGLGEEWYTMQASRAISQAIGRGWRHKDDWCLGILLDNKLSWTSNNIKEKFSPWIRDNISYFHKWNKFQKEIITYYGEHSVEYRLDL